MVYGVVVKAVLKGGGVVELSSDREKAAQRSSSSDRPNRRCGDVSDGQTPLAARTIDSALIDLIATGRS